MTNFTDDVYSKLFVCIVNKHLESDITAIRMWDRIKKDLFRIEGQEGLDSAARDRLLVVMDQRRVRGFSQLAKRYGYKPKHAPKGSYGW